MLVPQCSVCKLDPQRLSLINNALRDAGISLSELARVSGISKSSLHRHARHSDQKTGVTAIKKSADEAIGLTKPEILARVEELWRESQEGLAASKLPILLKKADGTAIELHAGDLKARAAFVRAGLQTLEAIADWSGYPRQIVSDQPGAAIQIVLPVSRGERIDCADPGAVEIGLPRR